MNKNYQHLIRYEKYYVQHKMHQNLHENQSLSPAMFNTMNRMAATSQSSFQNVDVQNLRYFDVAISLTINYDEHHIKKLSDDYKNWNVLVNWIMEVDDVHL